MCVFDDYWQAMKMTFDYSHESELLLVIKCSFWKSIENSEKPDNLDNNS
jgi:hypothetical protein